MKSLLKVSRTVCTVNGYEFWLPDAEVVAAWEKQFGGTFHTRECSEDALLFAPGAVENDPPLALNRLMVPLVVSRAPGMWNVVRNAESIDMARVDGKPSRYTVLCLER